MKLRLATGQRLSAAATIAPSSLNEEERTVDVTWTTGARVLRQSFDGPFLEELEVSKRAIDLSRLNAGAPVLNAHNGGGDALSVMAAVVPGSARIDGDVGVATLRFDTTENDPRAEQMFRKIANGIVTGISVGYAIESAKRVKDETVSVPVIRATRWTPYEITIAPIPADLGATFRAGEPQEIVTMEIDDIQNVAPVIERIDVDAIAKRAVETEREKVVAINAWARKFDLSDEFSARLVAETADKDEAQKRVFAEISSRPTPTDAIRPAVVSSVRDIGVDSARSGLENAIEHRINPSVQLTEEGRDFAGLPLLEMGRSYLGRHNISTRGMSAMDLAGAALNLSHRSMGTTDFPYLLANTANKRLASSYEGQVPSFEPLCRRVPMNDFKAQAVVKFGDAPVFESVSEGGAYKIGAISEGNESYQLATYGKKVVFTRQMMINDDLRALDRLPDMFARRARELESDLFWAQITGNPTMGDSVTLFHATHGNLGTGVIALAGLGAARKAVQVQTGLDGGKLGLRPRYLVVPVALEDTALQWTSQNMTAAQPSNVNPYANRGYEVISDPRLDDSSLLIWYLAASTDQVDIVEMGYLASSPGIYSEVREGFDVDGVEIKYRIDRTAKIIDHRGLYRSSGA